MGHISAPVRIAQRGRSPELRSLTRLRPLSAPFVQGARPPSGLAPCDLRSGPTLPRPPHPAPRTVTIAKRPSHRDGMKELNPSSWVLSRSTLDTIHNVVPARAVTHNPLSWLGLWACKITAICAAVHYERCGVWVPACAGTTKERRAAMISRGIGEIALPLPLGMPDAAPRVWTSTDIMHSNPAGMRGEWQDGPPDSPFRIVSGSMVRCEARAGGRPQSLLRIIGRALSRHCRKPL